MPYEPNSHTPWVCRCRFRHGESVGSPVAALRNGPYGSADVLDSSGRPPYGKGSLGIEVADRSTSLTSPSERVDFGNEVDFLGDPVLGLNKVGFHVFQTGANINYGGTKNMPNIRFEINPNLSARPGDDYSALVWVPDAAPVTNRWSGYIDATTTGYWYLTGGETSCNGPVAHCSLALVRASLNDGGAGRPSTPPRWTRAATTCGSAPWTVCGSISTSTTSSPAASRRVTPADSACAPNSAARRAGPLPGPPSRACGLSSR